MKASECWSLNDKRTPRLPEEKPGVVPTVEERAKNLLPDILARWSSVSDLKSQISDPTRARPRNAQRFCLPIRDIIAFRLPVPAIELQLARDVFVFLLLCWQTVQ